jgi:hypothetical protein
VPEDQAEAFRQQIVEELKKQVEARMAAVVIASEPDGGAELEGYVAWPDGHRQQFKRRANLTPGRFVVGSPASTEPPPVPETPLSTDASAADPEPSVAREGGSAHL